MNRDNYWHWSIAPLQNSNLSWRRIKKCNKKLEAQYHSPGLHQSLFQMIVSNHKSNSQQKIEISSFACQCQTMYNFPNRRGKSTRIVPTNDQRVSLTQHLKRSGCACFLMTKMLVQVQSNRITPLSHFPDHLQLLHTPSAPTNTGLN